MKRRNKILSAILVIVMLLPLIPAIPLFSATANEAPSPYALEAGTQWYFGSGRSGDPTEMPAFAAAVSTLNATQRAALVGVGGLNQLSKYGNNPYGPTVLSIGTPSYTGPALTLPQPANTSGTSNTSGTGTFAPGAPGLTVGTNMYMDKPAEATAVADAKGHLRLDPASYVTQGVMAAQFEKDKATGNGTDFWMDRVLARRGTGIGTILTGTQQGNHSASHEGQDRNGTGILQTRGRAIYGRQATAPGLGFDFGVRYTRNSSMGTLMAVSVSGATLSETGSTRYNTPSHYASTFGTGTTGFTVEQKKFMTENNVAVVLLKFINNTGTARTGISVSATSGVATSASGNELVRNNFTGTLINSRLTGRMAGRHGPDGTGTNFTAAGSTLSSGTFTVPANGVYEVAIMVAVTATEIPESRADYDKFRTMTNLELFQYQTQTYNQYWVDEMPYVETPNLAVNKAIQYHWWTMRYNSIDPHIPSYGYQFPLTIEGVDGYNNSIVLTQGMHLQDTGYFRTGRLAFGTLLSNGNTNYSSAYYDNPNTKTTANIAGANDWNWNSHYNQYIASAGTQIYKTQGGRADLALRLAYDFSSDARGQLDHFAGTTTGTGQNANNFMMSHRSGYTTGNDADGITINDGTARKDRSETAFIYGGAKGAKELYDLAATKLTLTAADTARRTDMANIEQGIRRQVQNRMWCTHCGNIEQAWMTNNSPREHGGNGGRSSPLKEVNNYQIFADYVIPLVGDSNLAREEVRGADFKDAFRWLTYNDEIGMYPYFTSATNDRRVNMPGSHNFSNINMTNLLRAYASSLKFYDVGQTYITGDYVARVMDWHAWHISSLGNISRLNNNEFFAYTIGTKSGYADADFNRTRMNPFYYNPDDMFRYGIHHNILGNFNWFPIEVMAGFTPEYDDIIHLQPAGAGYNYYIVDNIRYHGQDLTIVWRKPGIPVGGTNYGTDYATENWTYIPAEFAAAYPEGYTAYLNGERLFTLDKEAFVKYNPNTRAIDVYNNDANVTFQTANSYYFPAAIDVDLTVGMDDVLGVKQMVDNWKIVGIDLTQSGDDLTQRPVGGGTVTPSGSYRPSARRTQGWNELGSGDGNHQHRYYHTLNTHAEGRPTYEGPIKGTSVNWPHWSNHSTSNATDYYQVVWSVPQSFNTLKLFFYDDMRPADNSNTFKPPSSYTVQYRAAGTSAWVEVPDQLRTPLLANYNEINFDRLENVDGLRVTVTRAAPAFVAISGFQVFDAMPAEWENAPPVIELYANDGDDQVDDLIVEVGADIKDDGFPQIGGVYAPIYKWTVTSAPEGVTYQLVDADKPVAKVVATLPADADENTWTAEFTLKFEMWDGDPELYLEHPEERQPHFVDGTISMTLRSDPNLRDIILSYQTITYTLNSLDTLPVLPDKVIANFRYSGAKWVDVIWPANLTAEDLLESESGNAFYVESLEIADEPSAIPVRALFFVAVANTLQATGVDVLNVSVLAGDAPTLPVAAGNAQMFPIYAVLRGASEAHDSMFLRIKWEDIPATYWNSPGEYAIELDLDALPNSGAFSGLDVIKQSVNLTILPNGVNYVVSSLVSPAARNHFLGDEPAALPATVTARWAGTNIPDAPVAVTWDVTPEMALFTTTGTKTITGTVAETTLTVTMQITVIEVVPPVINAMNVPEYAALNTATAVTASASTVLTGTTLTYAWSVSPALAGNTISNASSANASLNFASYGSYKVFLTVTDVRGNSVSQERDIHIADTFTPDADRDMLRRLHTISLQYDSRQSIVHTQSTGWGASSQTAANSQGLVLQTNGTTWASPAVEATGGTAGGTSRWTNWSAAGVATARTAAGNVLDNANASSTEINAAYHALLDAINALTPAATPATAVTGGTPPSRTDNVAFVASRSASHVTNDARLYNINSNTELNNAGNAYGWLTHNGWFTSGHRPSSSASGGIPANSYWVQYEWPYAAKLTGSTFIFWTDGDGLQTPASVVYQYLPLDSNTWVTISGTYPTPANSTNSRILQQHTFTDPIEARALRVYMASRAANRNPALTEWQVFGELLAPEVFETDVVNKIALAGAMGKFQARNEADYTPVSWAAAKAAYDEAEIVFLDNEATQEVVNAATSKLELTAAALVPIDGLGDPDVNKDTVVDFEDLSVAMFAFGANDVDKDWNSGFGWYDKTPEKAPITYSMVDVLKDGSIDIGDLQAIISLFTTSWG